MVAVPEHYLRTVGFLCVEEADQNGNVHRVPKATTFFVRVRHDSIVNASVDYLVTARHCIDEARPYEKVFVRWNRKKGPFIEVETRCENWFTHDNADVATILLLPSTLPLGTDLTELDSVSISARSFVGPGPDYECQGVAQTAIGEIPFRVRPDVGHETFFLGLFTQNYGEERMLPVARFGHVSRMPSLLNMEHAGTRFQSAAYLMEFQSWGGHSGSPVFFWHPMVIQDEPGLSQDLSTVGVNFAHVTGLMGLLSAHYQITESAKTTGDMPGTIQTELNSGMAIVTPAESITQLLMREDIIAQRKELADRGFE